MAGRKPIPNSYICNLNDITFAIACRQQPSQGTEIELVVPVIFSLPLEEAERMIFLDVIEITAPDTDEKLYLTYYWRSLEEKNSAFRR